MENSGFESDLPADPYPFLCSNCGGQFKTLTAFKTHFSPKRSACAYKVNEIVTNLRAFTTEALLASVLDSQKAKA